MTGPHRPENGDSRWEDQTDPGPQYVARMPGQHPDRPSADQGDPTVAAPQVPAADPEATQAVPHPANHPQLGQTSHLAQPPASPQHGAPSGGYSYQPYAGENDLADPLFAGQQTQVEEVQERDRRSRGWIGPLVVMALALGAVLVVYLTTRGGSDQNTTAPAPLPTEGVSNTAPPSTVTSPTTSSTTSDEAPTSSSTSDTSTSATSGSSGTSGDSPSPENTASAPAPPSQSTRPEPTPSSTSPSSTEGGGLPGGLKQCSPRVGASSTTTCQFASAVGLQAYGKGPGSFTVRATSQATGQTYTMRCGGRPLTVCRGGRSAVVYVLNP